MTIDDTTTVDVGDLSPPVPEDLIELYRDLHRHPELSFQEDRKAAIVADHLRGLGFDVTTGVGRTGVVGVLRNGNGPVALLRADMDALPLQEKTGLSYASTARGVDHEGHAVDVFHACGHDVHVTCLIGAAAVLAGDRGPGRGRSCWSSSQPRSLGKVPAR